MMTVLLWWFSCSYNNFDVQSQQYSLHIPVLYVSVYSLRRRGRARDPRAGRAARRRAAPARRCGSRRAPSAAEARAPPTATSPERATAPRVTPPSRTGRWTLKWKGKVIIEYTTVEWALYTKWYFKLSWIEALFLITSYLFLLITSI